MANRQNTRRSFLRMVPLTAASLPFTETLLRATPLASIQPSTQPSDGGTQRSFQLLTSQAIEDAMHTLQAAPGNKNLLDAKGLPLSMVLTTEDRKSAKEFEYHEGRDHVVQVVEGTTLYEVGGTPVSPRNTGPGEWLTPVCEGATPITLKKGDILVLPRGTPHKRSTEASVTFVLISTTGAASV